MKKINELQIGYLLHFILIIVFIFYVLLCQFVVGLAVLLKTIIFLFYDNKTATINLTTKNLYINICTWAPPSDTPDCMLVQLVSIAAGFTYYQTFSLICIHHCGLNHTQQTQIEHKNHAHNTLKFGQIIVIIVINNTVIKI